MELPPTDRSSRGAGTTTRKNRVITAGTKEQMTIAEQEGDGQRGVRLPPGGAGALVGDQHRNDDRTRQCRDREEPVHPGERPAHAWCRGVERGSRVITGPAAGATPPPAAAVPPPPDGVDGAPNRRDTPDLGRPPRHAPKHPLLSADQHRAAAQGDGQVRAPFRGSEQPADEDLVERRPSLDELALGQRADEGRPATSPACGHAETTAAAPAPQRRGAWPPVLRGLR